MNSYDGDTMLTISVVDVRIEGVWYTLEIAVTPDGVVYSIVQVGFGRVNL